MTQPKIDNGRLVLKKTVCSDEGLTLETSATHQIPQTKNIPYQPLLIKPISKIDKQYFTKEIVQYEKCYHKTVRIIAQIRDGLG